MGNKNIFLTGDVHVGKSTAIIRFLNKYISNSSSIAGFKTKPLYENGSLKGYYIENQIQPRISNILENMVGINTDFGKGKSCYGIPEVFEKKGVEILCESLKIPNSIILMDELGFFEKDALEFKAQVHRTLDSQHRVLGVLKEKTNEFLNSIAAREDVKVIRVTLENRDSVAKEINKYWE
ncbi:nucleoside-triphosphatase [Clostridium tagluense]|uniref:nucleoside-triphosphatase n=1 Tax=Clostridium tagluense TaxID=360422 RepID=UPI001C6ECA24|nr:nucleoside-triphosphatase [Clostridium tagluense]MBW9156811.1 nucleoside-triphosphatase [Clostridium tagluense]WLC66293.1 nucleoside-triphosphatase [Clostridium tagluense]